MASGLRDAAAPSSCVQIAAAARHLVSDTSPAHAADASPAVGEGTADADAAAGNANFHSEGAKTSHHRESRGVVPAILNTNSDCIHAQASHVLCCVGGVTETKRANTAAETLAVADASDGDWAHFDALSPADPSDAEEAENQRKSHGGGIVEPFPLKLHRMLTDAEAERMEGIVGFFPHGRAFRVFKPKPFMEEIMPRYFQMTNFTSFIRQLNLWGFTRIMKGPDAGGYYHELFLRGRKKLCTSIIRIAIKGRVGVGSRSSRRKHLPDFYSMPPVKFDSEGALSNSNAGANGRANAPAAIGHLGNQGHVDLGNRRLPAALTQAPAASSSSMARSVASPPKNARPLSLSTVLEAGQIRNQLQSAASIAATVDQMPAAVYVPKRMMPSVASHLQPVPMSVVPVLAATPKNMMMPSVTSLLNRNAPLSQRTVALTEQSQMHQGAAATFAANLTWRQQEAAGSILAVAGQTQRQQEAADPVLAVSMPPLAEASARRAIVSQIPNIRNTATVNYVPTLTTIEPQAALLGMRQINGVGRPPHNFMPGHLE